MFVRLLLIPATAILLAAQTSETKVVDAVKVLALPVERRVELPGEFQPYQQTAIHAKVQGFVQKVLVDRGSRAKEGDLLAELSAPELDAQIAEAKARIPVIEAQQAEARASVVAAQSTLEKLKTANQTPGAVAGNEIIQTENVVAAGNARIQSLQQSIAAVKASVDSIEEVKKYLKITAPFSGVITTRYISPGALASPQSGPLFDLEQHNRLRLVVAVPERDAGAIPRKGQFSFKVPAYPGATFKGTVARSSGVIDSKTRSMAVELDVANPKGQLAPGMYPTVQWIVVSSGSVLLVPPTSVAVTTERTFVNRIRNGKVEWIDVVKGTPSGDRIEVRSPQLFEGDVIARRGTDELRPGTKAEGKIK